MKGTFILGIFILIGLIIEAQCIHPCNYWKDGTKPDQNDYAPKARTEYKAVQLDHKMYIFGGVEEGNKVASMKKMDMWNKQWEELKQEGTGPTARTGHAFVANDTSLFVVGGDDGTTYLNDVYRYKTKEGKWEQITTTGTAPAGRVGHTIDIYKDGLYVFGGNTTVGRTNDFYLLNLTTNVWSVKVPTPGLPPPAARTQHNSMALGPAFFYFGGDCAGANLCNDLYIFNFTSNMWIPGSLLSPKGTPPTVRRNAAGFHYNFSLTIVGGFGPSNEALPADIFRFHLFNLSWTGPHKVPTDENVFTNKGAYPSVAHEESIVITYQATNVLTFQADCYEPHPWWVWIVWGGGILLIAFLLLFFSIGYVAYITYDRNISKTAYLRMNYKEPGPPAPPADALKHSSPGEQSGMDFIANAEQEDKQQIVYEPQETPTITVQQDKPEQVEMEEIEVESANDGHSDEPNAAASKEDTIEVETVEPEAIKLE